LEQPLRTPAAGEKSCTFRNNGAHNGSDENYKETQTPGNQAAQEGYYCCSGES
jgi:hypothetical protein